MGNPPIIGYRSNRVDDFFKDLQVVPSFMVIDSKS